MDIIKRLNLNNNIKDVKSGSVIGAKNIMLDPVSSCITNEYGFSVAFDAGEIPGLGQDYKIKGAISCNEEICIFLNNGDTSKIYRLKDDGTGYIVPCNWKYEGGSKVIGTSVYNSKRELILAISETNIDNVPLKIINIDKSSNDDNLTYNLEEFIPKTNVNYSVENNGSLVCGVYTFFIRFKVQDESYTKWFQITDDIIIYNSLTKTQPVHFFLNTENNPTKNNIVSPNVVDFDNFEINENKQSTESIKLDIEISDTFLKEFDIAYIIKRNNEIKGRLLNSYICNNLNSITVSNNEFKEEVNISDFIEEPNQFYNVKNLVTYDNRLYLSNYKEYNDDIELLKNFVNTIIPKVSYVKFTESDKNALVELTVGTWEEIHWYETKSTTPPSYKESINYAILEKYSNNNKIDEGYKFFVNNILDIIKNNIIIKNNNGNKAIKKIIFTENPSSAGGYVYNPDVVMYGVDHDYYSFECETTGSYIKIKSIKVGVLPSYNITNTSVFTIIYEDDTTNQFCLRSRFNITKEIPCNNIYEVNRTLIPGQVYNFYAHFVRKDGSITQGFKLTKKRGEINNSLNLYTDYLIYKQYYRVPYSLSEGRCFPVFIFTPSNQIFNKYKGIVFTYENIEKTSSFLYKVDKKSNELTLTNSELIYNITNNFDFGNKIKILQGDDLKNIAYKNIENNIYKQNNIICFPDSDINDSEQYVIIKNTDNIYSNKIKQLYQLTPILYFKNSNESQNNNNIDWFLPSFYNRAKIITFDKSIINSPTSEYIYSDNGDFQSMYRIKGYFKYMYSHSPLICYSIKEDYDQASIVFISNDINERKTNIMLQSNKLKDLLELKEAYSSKPVKMFTNYNENTQNEFNKTIYRSDVISDESSINGFRHFNIENYKNILENKGNIVNVVGFGLYLLVHTEYSLFVFDRNNQLSNNAQLQIPDVFDIDYKELTPSGEGFGGLKDKDEAILTKHGYIWFDRITKSIFIFDGQSIKPISADIHKFLKNTNIHKIRFAEDYISNRLIITIFDKYQTRMAGRPVITNVDYLTLSYSFDTGTFISCHDYTFDENYKTYNNSYIFSDIVPSKLFVYNKDAISYNDLDFRNNPNVVAESLQDTIEIEQEGVNKLCSYVDIVFNDKYEMAKTLNSISYIMNKNYISYYNTDYTKYKHFNQNKLYSGFKLYISTDLTFSGLLDISKDEEVNNINSTKPHFNNGVWNFNAFRENLNQPVTDKELKLIEIIKYFDAEKDELVTRKINLDELKKAYEKVSGEYNKSDMRGLIFGKYFVLRFIFERNTAEDLGLKFETLDVNISKL